MACKTCRDFDVNSCTDIKSTDCISFQGEPDEDLDICLSDSLTFVMNTLITKINNLLRGRGIILGDLNLDDCNFIESILDPEEKNLLNVLNAYKEAICSLKISTDLNTATLESFVDVSLYTLGCLSPNDPCGDPITFKTLIQAIITKLCELNTQLGGIAESLLEIIEEAVGNILIGGAVKSCGGNGISYIGTGSTGQVVIEALVPPYSPILYTGTLTYFNVSGVGLPNTPMCGWYLCNGNNGTPNSTTLPQNLAGSLKYIMRLT